jgi:hypothetical protein
MGNNTWSYNATLRGRTALTCQWGCDAQFRLDLTNNNSCVAGEPSCSEVGGVCLASLGNSTAITFGNCTNGGTCSVCNTEYGFNGTACVKNYCEAGKAWNGFECTVDSVCASGCKYNSNCINIGMRINVSGNKYYCPLTGGIFAVTKDDGATCSDKYECKNNLCRNGKCLDFVGELRANVGFIGTTVCKLRRFLGLDGNTDAAERICLTSRQASS